MPASRDAGVQRQLSTEPMNDVSEDVGILLKGVGVEGRHHTATAQVNDVDQDLPDAETAPRPRALVEPNDTSDHQIGPQTSTVMSERGDCAIGRNQQRENIKAVHRFVANEACAGADVGVDHRSYSGVGPAQAIDDGRSLRVSDGVMSEKSRVGPRSYDTASAILNVHHAVTGDTQRAYVGLRKTLPPHRLHGVPPDLCEIHARLLWTRRPSSPGNRYLLQPSPDREIGENLPRDGRKGDSQDCLRGATNSPWSRWTASATRSAGIASFSRCRDSKIFSSTRETPDVHIMPDGEHFVFELGTQSSSATRYDVVLNWFEELKKKRSTH